MVSLRNETGLSLEQVAAGSGVPFRTLQNYERGAAKRPLRQTATALAAFYTKALRRRVTVEWLRGEA